ncbi:hypothetical protein Syun_018639 [Stephania yunnanensis]|uniref:Uncharacterized protein n=1 Tax=Stephania yunnanensis TaxID=152371 RepID=A0AAP0IUJ1_9MAGN
MQSNAVNVVAMVSPLSQSHRHLHCPSPPDLHGFHHHHLHLICAPDLFDQPMILLHPLPCHRQLHRHETEPPPSPPQSAPTSLSPSELSPTNSTQPTHDSSPPLPSSPPFASFVLTPLPQSPLNISNDRRFDDEDIVKEAVHVPLNFSSVSLLGFPDFTFFAVQMSFRWIIISLDVRALKIFEELLLPPMFERAMESNSFAITTCPPNLRNLMLIKHVSGHNQLIFVEIEADWFIKLNRDGVVGKQFGQFGFGAFILTSGLAPNTSFLIEKFGILLFYEMLKFIP